MDDLKNVKVGDVLAYSGSWRDPGLTKVERLTKTLIVCSAGRFDRTRGWAAGTGSSYSRSRVWIPTPADLLNMRILMAQRALGKLKVGAENVEIVEAMLATVKTALSNLEDAAK